MMTDCPQSECSIDSFLVFAMLLPDIDCAPSGSVEDEAHQLAEERIITTYKYIPQLLNSIQQNYPQNNPPKKNQCWNYNNDSFPVAADDNHQKDLGIE